MKGGTAFVVGNAIKHILFGMVIKPYKVFGNVRGICIVSLRSFHQRIIGEILPVFMFVPEVLAIVGERFIYGKVAPAFSSNNISEPMMKCFVCNYIFPAVFINQITRFLLGSLLVQHRCGVFPGTGYIIAGSALRIFGPGVIVFQFGGKEFQHSRRIPENLLCVRLIFLFNIIIYRNISPFILYDGIISYTHEEK